jgi:hypothetical protein
MSSSDVNFKKFKLNDLKKNSESVLGFTPKNRKLKFAYNEVILFLEEKKLDYACGNCKSPIDDKMSRCWACGDVLDEAEDPEMEVKEIERRAKKLGINTKKMELVDIITEIEKRESKIIANRRDSDLFCIEAKRINEKLGEILPDGWRITKSAQYNSYFDANGKRRIAVFHRGLNVHFSVDDGLLDTVENLEYLDPVERKRRHAGRSNYFYNGEISKNVIEICSMVMKRYSD